MKYILLMFATKGGVTGYHAWSQKDKETHMAALGTLAKELTESGEFVATQGLTEPGEAKVVRGESNGIPVTDGIFPESKEFLLGYWLVDVATPERAYAVAGRISAAPPGPVDRLPICPSKSGGSRQVATQLAMTGCPEMRQSVTRHKIQGEKTMKYILMMNCPRKGYELMGSWPKKAFADHIAFMHSLNKDLRESQLQRASPTRSRRLLCASAKTASPSRTESSRNPRSSSPASGSWTWKAPRRRTRSPPGGVRPPRDPEGTGNMPIEVRQVMSGPPEELP